jgi:hypothetical protein
MLSLFLSFREHDVVMKANGGEKDQKKKKRGGKTDGDLHAIVRSSCDPSSCVVVEDRLRRRAERCDKKSLGARVGICVHKKGETKKKNASPIAVQRKTVLYGKRKIDSFTRCHWTGAHAA